jgi:tRNA (cmo5U34)-methyltransferase
LKDVKNHFEEEAEEYDGLIVKLIPGYQDMVDSLIRSIPFESSKPIKVLDLGCGTGNITLAVKKRYPQAHVTCIDLAESMIEITRYKLGEYDDIEFHVADMRDFQYGENNYDLIISSLAMHHLQTDEEKIAVYQEIYDSLREGGVFLHADQVLTSSKYLEKANQEQWKEFMLKTMPLSEIEEKWLPTAHHEDHPAPLLNHIDWLREIGFKEVDVMWKYVKGAVFGGRK